MNWDAIGAIGEVVGALAVIFTIGYLARQIKDNSKEVRQSSIVAINDLVNDAYEPIYYNDRNIRIWVTGHQSPAELSEEDTVIFSLFMARLANVHLTSFSQYEYETLGSIEYQKYLSSLQSLLHSPGGQAWLNDMGGSDLFTAETLATLEQTGELQRSIVPKDRTSAA